MAPQVPILAAGGTEGGGIGTSFDRVAAALHEAVAWATNGHVVVLADLGSAVLTVDSVLEFDDDLAAVCRLADAPLVEGAVAAAVTANGDADLDAVLAAAERAGGTFAASRPSTGGVSGPAVADPVRTVGGSAQGQEQGEAAVREVATLRNHLGLHARPAAVLATLMATFDASVTIDGVPGDSVLGLMQLGATAGRTLVVEGSGAQAHEAVQAAVASIESGYGEV